MMHFRPDKALHLQLAKLEFMSKGFDTRFGRPEEQFPLYVRLTRYHPTCGVYLMQNTEKVTRAQLMNVALTLPIHTYIFYLKENSDGNCEGAYYLASNLDQTKHELWF